MSGSRIFQRSWPSTASTAQSADGSQPVRDPALLGAARSAAALARHGFNQGALLQMLYGVPTLDVPVPPEQIRITRRGRMMPTTLPGLPAVCGDGRIAADRPAAFRCYLEFVDGMAAGLGVLHIANRTGSMANGLTAPPFRGRGCLIGAALPAHT